MTYSALRKLLLIDAGVLFVLGAVLVFAPGLAERTFQFNDLPQGVHYILGLWGCVLMTLALGYGVAARDPVRHVTWVQIGILRGALEVIVGCVYLALGIVTLRQAGVGIAAAAVITVAYLVLYPRESAGA